MGKATQERVQMPARGNQRDQEMTPADRIAELESVTELPEEPARIPGSMNLYVPRADYDKLRDYAVAMKAENDRLEKLVYVPGVFSCAKCRVVLVSTTMHAHTGLMKANTEPQKCPNGCGPLWRRTERDAGNELCDRLEKAEAALAALQKDYDLTTEVDKRVHAQMQIDLATARQDERKRFTEVGWVAADGFPALKGSKPLEPKTLLYALTDEEAK